jgi:pimeloyl-ACP methyl ester carboxylesterase
MEHPMKLRIATALVCWLLFLPGPGRGDEGFFDSNGVKIRYLVEGRGESVLLIHGFTLDVEKSWGNPGTLKSLAKDYRVIALDNRGHDKPHDPKLYGTEMVEDAIRLLDHLKIDKAHVVGYSMGANITLKLLVTHHDRVLSATLVGSGGIRENGSLVLDQGALAESLEQGKGFGPLIEALTPAGKPKPTEEEIKQINQRLTADNDIKALAAVMRGSTNLAVSDEKLKTNHVPTLALIGEIDPNKKRVDELNGRLSNLQIVVLDGADHASVITRPEFVKELKEFLGKHPRKVGDGGKPDSGK